MCVCFKGAGEIAGLETDWWGEMAQARGEVGRVWGWMGQGRERVAREGDVFFGYVGANGSGVSEGVRSGCALGRSGDIG